MGVPGISGSTLADVYWGIGQIHGRLRPFQTLSLACAARGQCMQALWPSAALAHIDKVVARLDMVAHAHRAVAALPQQTLHWLQAYCDGAAEALAAHRLPWWGVLGARMQPPTPHSVAAGLLLTAYIGQGEGQERMERAWIQCMQQGADYAVMQRMFGAAVSDYDPALLQKLPPVTLGAAHAPAGGSNAWAVAAGRSASGKPLLAGDPHLPVGDLPGVFVEVRARFAEQSVLGASTPGLPGFVVGRTDKLAWSGTFAFADTLDLTVERIEHGRAARADGSAPLLRRQMHMGRRAMREQSICFAETDRGVLDAMQGVTLATRWSCQEALAQTLHAFLALPLAQSAAEAQATLADSQTLNLQFVLADTAGDVRKVALGCVPERRAGHMGLCPTAGDKADPWQARLHGDSLPHSAHLQVAIAANDGALPWATLPQPNYRAHRIAACLAQKPLHDVQSFMRMQSDVYSIQGQRLRPRLLAALPPGRMRTALQDWDLLCSTDSIGADAFSSCYAAALRGLAPRLGGGSWLDLLQRSEVATWWCGALDDYLDSEACWQGEHSATLMRAMVEVGKQVPMPLGQKQNLVLRHPVFARLGRAPFAKQGLPGSLATICQGNLSHGALGPQVTAPAYRMICDLAQPGMYTSLPGGIDERPWARSYAQWFGDWQAGRYHVLMPPTDDEACW